MLANYSFAVSHGEPYFQVALSGKNLIVGIEEFDNRNWRQYPLVVVSGKWVPEGEVLDVKRFDPADARAHHKVVKSMAVNTEVASRAFRAQLAYADLLRPEGRRMMTVEEITNIDVGSAS